MARILRRHIFVCFVVFDSWGFGKFARTHMERMGSSERERSRIAWSNLVGECPSTGFLSAAFASLCDMVGMREMVFDFFFAVRGMLLQRITSLRLGCLPLPGRLYRVKRRGHELRVRGFGVLVVKVIVGERAAGGANRICTGWVNRSKNSEKGAHTLRFV